MKTLILLVLMLPIFSSAQTTIDTLKNAKAWQNTFLAFNWYGTTTEGHVYTGGLNGRYNSDGTRLPIEIVRVDLATGKTDYKILDSSQTPANIGNALWAHTYDSTGAFYLGINYDRRFIYRLNYKDSIHIENLGNGFADNASLAYSMGMGTDGHIYFGASSGATYWSEYDPINKVWVHQYTHSIDDNNDYVQQIYGDSTWVYAQVGQRNNTIKLFAIRKSDNFVKELFHITAASRFQLEAKQDHHIYMSPGIIDTIVGTWWLYNGEAIKISNLRNAFPVNNRIDYYEVGNWGQPMARSFYDLYNSILYAEVICCYGNNTGWKGYTAYPIKSNRQPNTIKLLFGDKTRPNDVGYIGNNYGIWFWYDAAKDSASALGSTSFNIYSSIQRNDSTILFGTYPNGTVLEWNKNQAWTSITYNPNGSQNATSYTTNPRIVAEFRTHTPAQFHHAKFMAKIKNIYVVGGDVIRTGNTCSVGALDSATYNYWGYDCNKIDRLSMTGMAAWRDSLAIIATSNAYGGTPKIYFYEPVSNTMVDSFQVSGWNNYAAYNGIYVVGDTLIGSHGAYEFYKLNLLTKQLIKDTSYLYYYSAQLEDSYIGMNTPVNMPNKYMLKLPNWYGTFSFNHIIYDISYDQLSIYRKKNAYPQIAQSSSSVKAAVSFTAYPNPTKNKLHIIGSGEYLFIDMNGKILRRKIIIDSGDMFLEQLPSGVYNLVNTYTHASKKIVLMP